MSELHKNLGGRPAFVPSPAQRRLVRRALAEGRSLSSIAQALGLHRNTARKIFAAEIAGARQDRNATIISSIFERAIAGNVPAQRAFLRACDDWQASGRRLSAENIRRFADVLIALFHSGIAGSVPAMTEYLRRNRLGEAREERSQKRTR